MKSDDLFGRFEASISARSPGLVGRLGSPLPKKRIRRMLKAAGISGYTDSIEAVFSWKNGTCGDGLVSVKSLALFPQTAFFLPELNLMICDYEGFHEGAVYNPAYKIVDGLYFPIFWDGSTGYIGSSLVDGSIVTIDPESESMVEKCYNSMDDFIEEAIQSNLRDEILSCFRKT